MLGAVRFQGTQRGVFGLSNWSPLPKPGEVPAQSFDQPQLTAYSGGNSFVPKNFLSTNAPLLSGNMSGQTSERSYADAGAETRAKNNATKRPPEPPSAGQRLIAKFTYNAKTDSPLGQDAELSLKTMDKMTMLGPHRHQDFWWFVRMDDGREGYVPANYVTIFEEKVTSLPWLAGKVLDPLPQISLTEQSSYKPYKSAYDKADMSTVKQSGDWNCEICHKSFNGPQPFNAHMTSRAHRDEVEVQNAYK